MQRWTTSLAPQSRRRLRRVGGVLAGGLLVVAGAFLAARSRGASSWQNPLAQWLPRLFPGRTSCCSGLKQLHLALHAYAVDAAEPSRPDDGS